MNKHMECVKKVVMGLPSAPESVKAGAVMIAWAALSLLLIPFAGLLSPVVAALIICLGFIALYIYVAVIKGTVEWISLQCKSNGDNNE